MACLFGKCCFGEDRQEILDEQKLSTLEGRENKAFANDYAKETQTNRPHKEDDERPPIPPKSYLYEPDKDEVVSTDSEYDDTLGLQTEGGEDEKSVTVPESSAQKPEPPRISTLNNPAKASDSKGESVADKESPGEGALDENNKDDRGKGEKQEQAKEKVGRDKKKQPQVFKEPAKAGQGSGASVGKPKKELPGSTGKNEKDRKGPLASPPLQPAEETGDVYEEINTVDKEKGQEYTDLMPTQDGKDAESGKDAKDTGPGIEDDGETYMDVNDVYAYVKGEDAEMYVVLQDYKKGNFSLKKGEEVIVTDKSGDDWEVVVESRREGGRVPRSILAEPGSMEVQHLWYLDNRTEEEMGKLRKRLSKFGKPGNFFVRPSRRTTGDYALSLLQQETESTNQAAGNTQATNQEAANKQIRDYKIVHISLEEKDKYYIFRRAMFSSLEELVDHYKGDADGLVSKLTAPCPRIDPT